MNMMNERSAKENKKEQTVTNTTDGTSKVKLPKLMIKIFNEIHLDWLPFRIISRS